MQSQTEKYEEGKMGVGKLMKIAFEEGCGIPFASALRSEEYKELKDREYSVYGRFPEKSREGSSLRTFPFDAAQLLQNHYSQSKKKLETVHAVQYSKRALKERALVRFLGKQLILSATEQLPDSLIKLAERFRSLDDYMAKWQCTLDLFLEVQEILASSFSPEDLKNDNVYAWANASTEDLDYKGVLPKAFGKYGQKGSLTPVCLGMAILLSSWAKLAGADFMLVQPLAWLDSPIWQSEQQLSQSMLDVIKQRNLNVKPEFIAGLKENVTKAEAHRHLIRDFHAAIAIKLKEQVWLYVDPYISRFGWFIPDKWQPEWIFDTLSESKESYPGLSIVGNDRGLFTDWLDSLTGDINQLVESAKKLDDVLDARKPVTEDYPWRLKEVRPLIALARLCYDEEVPEYAIMKAMVGFKASTQVSLNVLRSKLKRLTKGGQFQEECFKRLSGLYLAWGKKLFYEEMDSLKVKGGFVHPSMEFSNPEFMIALLVLNHLNCWIGDEKDNLGMFSLKHSTSQILWHQTIARLGPDYDAGNLQPFVDGSTRLVQSLRPHLHARCLARLELLRRGGKVKDGTEEEAQNPEGMRQNDQKDHGKKWYLGWRRRQRPA